MKTLRQKIEAIADKVGGTVREGYSGRFMYGATCYGVVCDDTAAAIREGKFRHLGDASTDSMGRSSIVYWPHAQESGTTMTPTALAVYDRLLKDYSEDAANNEPEYSRGRRHVRQIASEMGLSAASVRKGIKTLLAVELVYASGRDNDPAYTAQTEAERDADRVKRAARKVLHDNLVSTLEARGLREDDIDRLSHAGCNDEILLALLQNQSFTYNDLDEPVAVESKTNTAA